MKTLIAGSVTPAEYLVVLVALALPTIGNGCTPSIALRGVEPTDLSTVKIGAARQKVEQVLGPPIKTEEAETSTVATYQYDMGAPGHAPSGDEIVDYAAGGLWLLDPITTPMAMAGRREQIRAQRGTLVVTYGRDDHVTSLDDPDADRRAIRSASFLMVKDTGLSDNATFLFLGTATSVSKTVFSPDDQQVTLHVQFDPHFQPAPKLRVDWIDPNGDIFLNRKVTTTPGNTMEMIVRLPIRDHEPSGKPGRWWVLVHHRQTLLVRKPFVIDPRSPDAMEGTHQ